MTSLRVPVVILALAVYMSATRPPLHAQGDPATATAVAAMVAADTGGVMGQMRRSLSSGRLSGTRWPRLADVVRDLTLVYDSVGWQPLWVSEGRTTPTARSVVRYLALADQAGLVPSDYDAALLDSLAVVLDSTMTSGSASAERESAAARFEATMSVAVVRMLSTLQWGRVNPRDAHEDFPITRDDYDLRAAMRSMATGGDPIAVFNEAEPPFLHYRLLKGQLSEQKAFALDSTAPAAAKRMATRINQIELSLERWRWLPRTFPGRVIIVNIPEFRLHAFDRLTADSTSLFSMDVVVGQAFDHRTPVFMRDLKYLAFSPYWEVPQSIGRKEIRPKAVRAPSYLTRNHYVLLRGTVEVPPTADNIAAIGSSVRVRQLPGKDNALGRVKFMLPNLHNVYLHDTPTQSAFQRERRDLSHGCIRLADPVGLAKWVLRDRPDWTDARLDSAMSRTTPLDVPLTEHIPVLILYGTAIAERSGEMKFLRDIYGHDKRLNTLLSRGYPYPR